METPTTPVPFS